MDDVKWVPGGYRSDCKDLWLLVKTYSGVCQVGVSFLNDEQLWDRYTRVQQAWVITPEVTSLEEAKAVAEAIYRMGG